LRSRLSRMIAASESDLKPNKLRLAMDLQNLWEVSF
jgi:hypothetical protein